MATQAAPQHLQSAAPSPGIGGRGRLVLLANVVAEVGIVITGGLVRLTGSGLGCPTWPECTDGSLVPVADQHEGLHSFVEFGNRLLTFAVLVTAVAALVVVLRSQRPVRRSLLWLAIGVLLGIFGQAGLGGITVLLELHPATVAAHFMLSMVMIALAFVLYRRASDSADRPVVVVVRRELRILAQVLVGVALTVLVLGTVVTGTGPHSGDADQTVRFGLDPRTISWLHSDVVLVFVGLAVAFTLGTHLTQAPRPAIRAGFLVLGAALFQGLVGYVQFFSALPIALVSLHMLGACLVWLATLNLGLSTRTRGVVPTRAAADPRPPPRTAASGT